MTGLTGFTGSGLSCYAVRRKWADSRYSGGEDHGQACVGVSPGREMERRAMVREVCSHAWVAGGADVWAGLPRLTQDEDAGETPALRQDRKRPRRGGGCDARGRLQRPGYVALSALRALFADRKPRAGALGCLKAALSGLVACVSWISRAVPSGRGMEEATDSLRTAAAGGMPMPLLKSGGASRPGRAPCGLLIRRVGGETHMAVKARTRAGKGAKTRRKKQRPPQRHKERGWSGFGSGVWGVRKGGEGSRQGGALS